MKDFTDLTDAELVALDPALPALPDTAPRKPDMVSYVLGGWEFSDRADALRVLEVLHTCTSYGVTGLVGRDYNSGWKWIPKDVTEITISERPCFREETAARFGVEMDRRAQEKTAYDKAKAEYDSIDRSRTIIRDEMTTRLLSVLAVEARRGRLRAEFQRYLELAEGRRRVAARFLASAHKDAPTLVPELFQFTVADPPDPKPRAYHNDDETTAPAAVANEIPF